MAKPWSTPRRTAAWAAASIPGASPPACTIATRGGRPSLAVAADSWGVATGEDMVSKMRIILSYVRPRAATAP